MTAKPDLPPSSVTAFTEALHGERGSLDAWLEVNDECEVRAHVEAYARANLSELQREIDEQCRLNSIGAERELALATKVSELQREIEALRAEVPDGGR